MKTPTTVSPFEIYLIGKVGGKKRELEAKVKALRPNASFIASDDHYDESNHGAHFKEVPLGDIQHAVGEYVVSNLLISKFAVAYLNTPDAYGSIAEIAFLSASSITTYLFIEYDGDDYDKNCPFKDAYALVASLPYVQCFSYQVTLDSAANLVASFIDERDKAERLESPIEKLLWDQFSDELKGQCEPQFQIGKYRLDFAFPNSKLAVECDGHEFHASKEQRGHDAERDRFLLSQGWRVMRFTGTEIYQKVWACAYEIRSALTTVNAHHSLR